MSRLFIFVCGVECDVIAVRCHGKQHKHKVGHEYFKRFYKGKLEVSCERCESFGFFIFLCICQTQEKRNVLEEPFTAGAGATLGKHKVYLENCDTREAYGLS